MENTQNNKPPQESASQKSGGEQSTYEGLDFGPDELAQAMRRDYDELIAFVTTPEFKAFHEELMSLPRKERPAMVSKVLFQQEELRKRNIVVPDGILIQTSAFGDRRPTLFAVKKFLPKKFHRVWENVNITFDNEYTNEVSRHPELAWRPPLPVALQNALLAADADLQSVPVDRGVNAEVYAAGTKAYLGNEGDKRSGENVSVE